jgi:hypothetical protein
MVNDKVSISCAQPKIEPGSVLDTMVALGIANASVYLSAVVEEVKNCLDTCDFTTQASDIFQVREQIHALKNVLALTGSSELLGACDQLGRDVYSGADYFTLERRYKAIAKVGMKLIKQFEGGL